MIIIELNVKPAKNKINEFTQTIYDIRDQINSSCSECNLQISNTSQSYSIYMNFVTYEDCLKHLNSYQFTLLFGAIKTLSNNATLSINGNELKLVEFNVKSIEKVIKLNLKDEN